MNIKNALNHFLKYLLIAGIGISQVLFLMAKLSEFGLMHISKYIYFPFAMITLVIFMYFSMKILFKNPYLYFILLIYSFYLLIGHGQIYSHWQNRNSGEVITATSMINLTHQLKEIKSKNQTISFIKPIPEFKIYPQYGGYYHYSRTIQEKYAEFHFFAVPYANTEQFKNKYFPLWIVCVQKKSISTNKFCYENINLLQGGAYLIDPKKELKAVKDSISTFKLTSIDQPLILEWASNPQVDINNALKFNAKVLKIIILSWLIMSLLSSFINLVKGKQTQRV